MSTAQRTLFLNTLTTLPLDGNDLARVLMALREVAPTNAELIALLEAMDFAVDDVAKLLFNLRLEPTRLEQLMNTIAPSTGARLGLLIALTEQESVHSALIDWEFANLRDISRLPAFLAARNLTAAQVADFLEGLPLLPGEIEQTLSALAALDPQRWPMPINGQPLNSSPAENNTPGRVAAPAPSPQATPREPQASPPDTAAPVPPTATPTATPTVAPPTSKPERKSTKTPVPTETPIPSNTPRPTPVNTPIPTPTEQPTRVPTPTLEATPVPTETAPPPVVTATATLGETIPPATDAPGDTIPPGRTRNPGGTIPPGRTRTIGGTIPPAPPANGEE